MCGLCCLLHARFRFAERPREPYTYEFLAKSLPILNAEEHLLELGAGWNQREVLGECDEPSSNKFGRSRTEAVAVLLATCVCDRDDRAERMRPATVLFSRGGARRQPAGRAIHPVTPRNGTVMVQSEESSSILSILAMQLLLTAYTFGRTDFSPNLGQLQARGPPLSLSFAK